MDFKDLTIEAMRQNKRVSLTYNGEDRLVEVHAVGISSKGHPVARVYQVVGGSAFSQSSGWKMLNLDKIEKAEIIEVQALTPRPGYKPGDIGMGTIYMEISDEAGPPLTS